MRWRSGHITGKFPGAGGCAPDRRLAALSALSDQGRQAGGLRRAGAEILAGVHVGDRACAEVRRRPPRSGGDQGGGGGDHRQPHAQMNGGRCWRRPIAASPSSRRWRRRCAIRISSAADCSTHKVAGASGATMPALPVPIDPAFRAQTENEAAARARRRQQARYSASPRISRGCEADGATPSRKTARRKGPIRSMR